MVYNRAVARGRELFGALVPYGEVWDPGADEATRIELSHRVTITGQPLPAGRYSIWTIPDPDEWTLIFSRASKVEHIPYPEGRTHFASRCARRPVPTWRRSGSTSP